MNIAPPCLPRQRSAIGTGLKQSGAIFQFMSGRRNHISKYLPTRDNLRGESQELAPPFCRCVCVWLFAKHAPTQMMRARPSWRVTYRSRPRSNALNQPFD